MTLANSSVTFCFSPRAAGGAIKVGEFVVSRRHLSFRAYAGYWNDSDGRAERRRARRHHNSYAFCKRLRELR
jgi:hypothetical protein